MTGPESKLERIAQAIQDCVAGVTEEAGYAVTVSECLRPKRSDEVKLEDYLVLLGQMEDAPAESMPQGYDDLVQRFTLDLFVLVGEDEDDPIDTVLNRFRAEVLRAVLADRQWDGLALDTIFEGGEPFATSAGSAEGLRLTLAVTYRTLENDPYDGALD